MTERGERAGAEAKEEDEKEEEEEEAAVHLKRKQAGEDDAHSADDSHRGLETAAACEARTATSGGRAAAARFEIDH